jgi:hypothetical protein
VAVERGCGGVEWWLLDGVPGVAQLLEEEDPKISIPLNHVHVAIEHQMPDLGSGLKSVYAYALVITSRGFPQVEDVARKCGTSATRGQPQPVAALCNDCFRRESAIHRRAHTADDKTVSLWGWDGRRYARIMAVVFNSLLSGAPNPPMETY